MFIRITALSQTNSKVLGDSEWSEKAVEIGIDDGYFNDLI